MFGGVVSEASQTFDVKQCLNSIPLFLFVAAQSPADPPGGRTQTEENTLTLEGQLCWSCGAVEVRGGGCSRGRWRPAPGHRYTHTVCFENSLSCFT